MHKHERMRRHVAVWITENRLTQPAVLIQARLEALVEPANPRRCHAAERMAKHTYLSKVQASRKRSLFLTGRVEAQNLVQSETDVGRPNVDPRPPPRQSVLLLVDE